MLIQSPTLSMLLADSWMPDTKPRMLSRKTSMKIAAEAPRPVRNIAGERSRRIEKTRMTATRKAMTCPVCIKPFSGLPFHSSRRPIS